MLRPLLGHETFCDMEISEHQNQTITPITGRPRNLRSATTNGNRPFAQGGDGRGVWVRRWRDLTDLHVGDLGGHEACSEAQLSLCRRIATTEVTLEQLEARLSEGAEVDLDLYNRLAGNLRRMLESIGLERRAKDLTPDSDVVAHFRRRPRRNAE